MSTRIEAAAKVLRFRLEGIPKSHGWNSASEREQFRDDAVQVLKAADAATFNDDAVERAVAALAGDFPFHNNYRPAVVELTVRAVIAALSD